MKTKIKWRLSKLPTPSELAELVKDKIITHEEAHEVLFDHVPEEEVDAEALKKEIVFLRQVVEDLSKSRIDTVRVIEKHINHYDNWLWTQPYMNYCNGAVTTTLSGTTTASGAGIALTGDSIYFAEPHTASITELKTF